MPFDREVAHLLVEGDFVAKDALRPQALVEHGEGDRGRGGDGGHGQDVPSGQEGVAAHQSAQPRVLVAAELDGEHPIELVGPLQDPGVRVAAADRGRDPIRGLPVILEGDGTDPVVQARRVAPHGHRAQRTGAVSGGHLHLVTAAGLEHELARHAPGRALALGHEAAHAPAAGIRDAPVELHDAPAARLRRVGHVGEVGVRHHLERPGQVRQQGGEETGRRRVRLGGLRALRPIFEGGAALVTDQPLQVPRRARVAVLGRLRVLAIAGGVADGRHADGEGGVLVGKDQDAPRRRGRVPVTQRPQGVRAGRERRHREPPGAVGQGDESHRAHAPAEQGDDRARDGRAMGVLDPAQEAAGRRFRAQGGSGQQDGHDRDTARERSHRCPPSIRIHVGRIHATSGGGWCQG